MTESTDQLKTYEVRIAVYYRTFTVKAYDSDHAKEVATLHDWEEKGCPEADIKIELENDND
jgi:hypothetical protein